jgi:hypothetical protein
MATTELHRTTVDIEVDAFEEARALLGTNGYRDTVNKAMREVVRLHKLRRLADLIRNGELPGEPLSPEYFHEIRHRRTHDIVPR